LTQAPPLIKDVDHGGGDRLLTYGIHAVQTNLNFRLDTEVSNFDWKLQVLIKSVVVGDLGCLNVGTLSSLNQLNLDINREVEPIIKVQRHVALRTFNRVL
jgi:hypothetical protein